MASKRIGDFLATGLLGISIYIFLNILNILPKIGLFAGLIGSITLIISQGWFLINWIRRKNNG